MNKEQIVGFSIDKVQTFLTEVIHSHVQEKQTENATLKNIMNSSKEISIDFHSKIKETFSETEMDELLSCSGVYIFSCNMPTEDIEAKMNELFLEYYKNSQGQKRLRCVSFSAEGYNEIKAIQEAKKCLKEAKYFNKWIEKNREVIFTFNTIHNAENGKNESGYPMFANEIDKLFDEEEAENDKRFRIAVIKADLDGMGKIFKEIENYEAYKKVSQIINEKVSLDNLHNAAQECGTKAMEGWIFPYYIAGDDIFFAVSVANLIKGVNVCRKILQDIKDELVEVCQSMDLSMSIGIDITYNRQPVRYYMDMVERQLKKAKEAEVPQSLKEFVFTKIAIYGLTYIDTDYNGIKTHKKNLKCLRNKKPNCECKSCKEKRTINSDEKSVPIWNFFLNDVNTLNYIKTHQYGEKELLGSSGFFYKLLERLSDKEVQDSEIKYINSVLYHLLPEHLDGADKELQKQELFLKAGVIRQLHIKEKGRIGISLKEMDKQRLETYLRLMLLFSDRRFQIREEFDSKEKSIIQGKNITDARKCLFNKSLHYLYEEVFVNKKLGKYFVNKEENEKLRDISVEKEVYKKVTYFKTLHIEKSMFFKLHDTSKVSIDRAADMIELHNNMTEEDVKKLNTERKTKGKVQCYLYFDKKIFCSEAKKSNEWTPDFVDSLMLLYEYNKMNIKLKSILK